MSSSAVSYQWYEVETIENFPIRQGKRVLFKDYDVAVFNLGDKFLAIDNQCPHKKGPLADGMVYGESVFCPLHTLRLSLKSGCALSGGEGRVKSYPVKIIEGKVFVAFENGSFKKEE